MELFALAMRSLKPSVSTLSNPLAPSHATTQDKDRYRDATQPWRSWYKLERWRRLRLAIFLRDGFTCAMCGKLQGDTSKLACDHRQAHKGNSALFWDEANLQTLCKPCHDSRKQRLDLASNS
jgi:5-methylcytosine-specific restriction protein A